MNNRRLYTGFSFFQFMWFLFLRVAAAVGMIYTLSHHDENPVMVSVVAIILLLFILFFGDDQIVVSPDKIIQKTNSIFSLFFNWKGKIYKIETIKTAYLSQPVPENAVEIGAALLLAFILPRRRNTQDTSKPIFFDLKEGKTVTLSTYLEEGKMKKIVDLVNALVKK